MALSRLDGEDLLNILNEYFTEFLVEEAERPSLKKVRAYLAATFHPDSDTMRGLEHDVDADRMTPRPRTVPDADAAFPYAGLDAPLGG